jgi:peptidoglycan/xylan/chitin deacetylase (PgdA/CDA1 family)
MINHGKFIISLDFELMWGVRDKKTIAQYGENIKGVHAVIPRLLQLFNQYKIKSTFSTVGFLFFKNKEELLTQVPNRLPQYKDKNLSPYNGYFTTIGTSESNDLYHYAPNLIKEIQKYEGQEIGTHTFCHYYCLEEGQTIEDFRDDIKRAISVAEKRSIKITSLIFPRNQFNDEYLKVCLELGIFCYRGNEKAWLYKALKGSKESRIRRALRLIDSYINISGHNTYSDDYMSSKLPINIPSSRFLRPYSKKLDFLDTIRLHRIKSGMTYAAKHNQTFHLWWHPHNFGINQEENFFFLEKILQHYQLLSQKYNFKSYTMSELAYFLINGKN